MANEHETCWLPCFVDIHDIIRRKYRDVLDGSRDLFLCSLFLSELSCICLFNDLFLAVLLLLRGGILFLLRLFVFRSYTCSECRVFIIKKHHIVDVFDLLALTFTGWLLVSVFFIFFSLL